MDWNRLVCRLLGHAPEASASIQVINDGVRVPTSKVWSCRRCGKNLKHARRDDLL